MKYTSLLILVVFIAACKKSEERSCFKSVGEESTLIIEPGHFDKMYLGPHIQYCFIQDTVDKVVLEGGENLLNFIDISVADEKLYVSNVNKCNFLRSYDKHVKATIYFKDLINIEFDGTLDTECQDTIQSDYLSVTMNESAGKLNLLVNCKVMYATVNKNWGNFNFWGNVDFLKISVFGNGFGSAYDLKVKDSIHLISRSGETVDINADGIYLRSQIHSSGDIWYKGTPTSINHQSFGSGELVDKN